MPHRCKTVLTLLAPALLVAGCDATADGVVAWRGGRFGEALTAFRDAESRAGDRASPELLYDHALAASRAGEPAESDRAAQAAAACGGPRFEALRDFLRGNTAWSRAETAEFQSELPGSPPGSLDRAIAQAQAARDAWKLAAASRDDWPQARRNVQRAAILLAHLAARKAGGQKPGDQIGGGRAKPKFVPTAKQPDDPEAPPLPEPPRPRRDPGATDPAAKAADTEPLVADLTRDEVLRLFETLDAKEREKLDLRRARRAVQPADVERDW